MQQENPKVVTVVWSGGFDSTFVLLDECDKAKKDPNNIYIQCLTTSFDNTGETKNDRERDAREKIKRYIARTYPSVNIKYANLEMKFDNNEYRFNSSNDGISQPIIWICSLIPLLDIDTTIKFGYLKCDDAMSSRFKQDVIALFDAASKLVSKNIKLEFPLENYNKNHVIAYLMNEVTEVFEYCTSCENSGINDKCGHCVPCQHLRETLINLCVDGHSNVRKLANQYLKDWFDIDVNVTFNEEPLIKATEESCDFEGVVIDSESYSTDNLLTCERAGELSEQVDFKINDDLNTDSDSVSTEPAKSGYCIEHTPYSIIKFTNDNVFVSADLVDGKTFPIVMCSTIYEARDEVNAITKQICDDISNNSKSRVKINIPYNYDGLVKNIDIIDDGGQIYSTIIVWARRRTNE